MDKSGMDRKLNNKRPCQTFTHMPMLSAVQHWQLSNAGEGHVDSSIFRRDESAWFSLTRHLWDRCDTWSVLQSEEQMSWVVWSKQVLDAGIHRIWASTALKYANI